MDKQCYNQPLQFQKMGNAQPACRRAAMKNQREKKSTKLLRIGCLSACIATAWTAGRSAYGQNGSIPPLPVPEPSTLVLVASGVAAAAIAAKKKFRK